MIEGKHAYHARRRKRLGTIRNNLKPTYIDLKTETREA